MHASVNARGRDVAGRAQETRNHITATVTGPISRLSGSARLPSSIGVPMITAITRPAHSAARLEKSRNVPQSAAIIAARPLRMVSAWSPVSLVPKSIRLRS